MKRCQKCNRTYPDDNQKFCTTDGGLLVNAEEAFDPNATIQSNTGFPPPPAQDTVDLNATIASSSTAETAVLPRNTGPTGAPTFVHQGSAPLSPQSPSASLPPPPAPPAPPTPPAPPAPPAMQRPSAPLPPAAAASAKKKSKLPLILGILAVLLVLGAGAVVAAFFLVIKPRLDQTEPNGPVATRTIGSNDENVNKNSNTTPVDTPAPTTTEPEFTPPADAVRFQNSPAKLDGKLAEHYVDFSFYYPKSWSMDPKAGVAKAGSFVKVEKTQEDQQGIYLLENASVSWYSSNGTFESDSPAFPDRVKEWENTIAPGYPGYQKVSEGETLVNSQKAYEVRFMGTFKNAGEKDLPYWGRVIFIPSGGGQKTGALVTLLATSLAPEISSAEDIGVKGEMPLILKSFKMGKVT